MLLSLKRVRGLDFNEEFEDWTCTCSKEMFLIYEDIVEMQKELSTLSEEFGGYTDGWGRLFNSRFVIDQTGKITIKLLFNSRVKRMIR